MKKLNVAIKSALLAAVALTATNVSASDIALLQTLYENGVLNKAQFEKLSKQEAEKTKNNAHASSAVNQISDWTSKVKIGGDMRFRQEFRDSDAKNSEKNRTRIRARLKVNAQVNEEVQVGFRLVTAGGTTSTNQTLEGGFGGKDIYFDRAFIKWSPLFAKGAHLIAGKIKQPWFSVTNNIWDTDVNPEGLTLTYQRAIGPVKLRATSGYFVLSNDDKGSFSDDMNMYHAGISGAMHFSDAAKATLGFNTFLYNGTTVGAFLNCETGKTCPAGVTGFAGDNVNGDADADFKLYEVAGKVELKTRFLPIKLFSNYVINTANGISSDEDSAWMVGIASKYKKFKFSYDYRDTQLNAVPDSFNDSDFNAGATASRGHVIKLGYGISKNFSIGLAYLSADEYTNNNEGNDANTRESLQFDLKAKF